MIISSPTDYREAARRKLPRFLFDYIDGGAYGEHTLRANVADLAGISLKQRILPVAKRVCGNSATAALLNEAKLIPTPMPVRIVAGRNAPA